MTSLVMEVTAAALMTETMFLLLPTLLLLLQLLLLLLLCWWPGYVVVSTVRCFTGLRRAQLGGGDWE